MAAPSTASRRKSAAYQLFRLEECGPSQCCSGQYRQYTAYRGELVLLPAQFVPNVQSDYGDALKPIKGAALKGVLKRAQVKSIDELAEFNHQALQAAREA